MTKAQGSAEENEREDSGPFKGIDKMRKSIADGLQSMMGQSPEGSMDVGKTARSLEGGSPEAFDRELGRGFEARTSLKASAEIDREEGAQKGRSGRSNDREF